ncbi:metal-dependent hydrolase [Halorubellus sp. JP-L1]|uniref:metal-dependent hydrolase n=1 Tax=Halorubellus sp. JP-L1 TaxID=2715753 RepID=UPI001407A07E|nr:metal-dependent hydrolase [Halorubellus sp. JP-L1]NHN43009.1 metal-dependent hydrolase [Halorubellus sp. JP-L1]
MVDIMGHLAFGLLFLLPAWFLWSRRVSIAFVGLGLVTSLLPDIDLWLSRWFPAEVHHHGVTHTVVFVAAASIVAGALAAAVLTKPLDRWLGWDRFDAGSMFAFSSLAFFLGGTAHVFADILSAPDISTPIEPFWPLYNQPLGIDLIYYNDPLWNSVFLAVMLVVHVGVALAVSPNRHRYRLREQLS